MKIKKDVVEMKKKKRFNFLRRKTTKNADLMQKAMIKSPRPAFQDTSSPLNSNNPSPETSPRSSFSPQGGNDSMHAKKELGNVTLHHKSNFDVTKQSPRAPKSNKGLLQRLNTRKNSLSIKSKDSSPKNGPPPPPPPPPGIAAPTPDLIQAIGDAASTFDLIKSLGEHGDPPGTPQSKQQDAWGLDEEQKVMEKKKLLTRTQTNAEKLMKAAGMATEVKHKDTRYQVLRHHARDFGTLARVDMDQGTDDLEDGAGELRPPPIGIFKAFKWGSKYVCVPHMNACLPESALKAQETKPLVGSKFSFSKKSEKKTKVIPVEPKGGPTPKRRKRRKQHRFPLYCRYITRGFLALYVLVMILLTLVYGIKFVLEEPVIENEVASVDEVLEGAVALAANGTNGTTPTASPTAMLTKVENGTLMQRTLVNGTFEWVVAPPNGTDTTPTNQESMPMSEEWLMTNALAMGTHIFITEPVLIFVKVFIVVFGGGQMVVDYLENAGLFDM